MRYAGTIGLPWSWTCPREDFPQLSYRRCAEGKMRHPISLCPRSPPPANSIRCVSSLLGVSPSIGSTWWDLGLLLPQKLGLGYAADQEEQCCERRKKKKLQFSLWRQNSHMIWMMTKRRCLLWRLLHADSVTIHMWGPSWWCQLIQDANWLSSASGTCSCDTHRIRAGLRSGNCN